jgi:hypothetical protein
MKSVYQSGLIANLQSINVTGKTRVLLVSLSLVLLFSCGSTKEIIEWNVELKDSEIPITDRCDPNKKLQSVKCIDRPLYLPPSEVREARVRALGIPCEPKEDPPIYEIPISRVKRITYVADPLQPPVQAEVKDLEVIQGCCRVRKGLLFFDKLELRGFLGYRGSGDSVVYPTATGQTVYKSDFFGFERGGSSMILGFELVGLWNVPFIDKSNSLQMGIITGVWPMDGSTFIPVGFHTRYTFNQFPAKYGDNCNSWYVYGNVGLPLDFTTKAPVFGKDMDRQRLFYGLGIGHDWAITCGMDFSLDVGFRRQNLPLPPIDCCPSIPDEDRNPFRNSTALLLRFGLTF